MQQILRITMFSILPGITLTAMFLVVGALAPGLVKTSREHYEKTPGRTFWLGLVNVLFLAAVFIGIVVLMERTGLQFLAVFGIIVLVVFSFGAVVGMASITQTVGARLYPKHTSARQNLYGALLALLASLTPFVGWAVLFPYLLISGFGGSAISYYESRKQNKAAK